MRSLEGTTKSIEFLSLGSTTLKPMMKMDPLGKILRIHMSSTIFKWAQIPMDTILAEPTI